MTDNILGHIDAGTKLIDNQGELVPEVWSAKMIVARENYLVAAKVVMRADDEVANFGDVIHFPEVGDATATEVSPGTDVSYQAFNDSEVTITINKHYESSFLVHDRFSAQTKYRYADKKAEKCGYALGKTVDSAILALYSSAANNVGSGSAAISELNIIKANRLLDSADVPADDRHFIIESYGKAQMNDIDNFVQYQITGKASPAVTTGKRGYGYGDIWGVTVHVSNNVPVEAATPAVVHGLFLHREAIGLAIQKGVTPEKQRKAEKLADLYVTQVLFGVGVLRSDHMVDFRYSQADAS
jgi:hypothetical protein